MFSGVSDATVYLHGNKWEGPLPTGTAAIEFDVSGSLLIVEHNFFGDVQGGQMYKPSGNAVLVSRNNIYSCAQSDLHLTDFPRGHGIILENDIYRRGGNSDLILRSRSLSAMDQGGDVKQLIGLDTDTGSLSEGGVILSKNNAPIFAKGLLIASKGIAVQTKTVTGETLLTPNDSMVFINGPATVTLPPATTYLQQFGPSPIFILKRLDNSSSVVALRDEHYGPIMNLLPNQSVTLISDGVQWRSVGN